jgi:phage terminase small subunit
MARKIRKSTATKRKKKSRSKSRSVTRKKSRPSAKKRRLRKRRPKTLGGKVSNAFHTVVDTIKDTDKLRNKMELPSTSETE